jgi:hypothetical protein
MAGSVVVEQASVAVVPGATATATIRVRNTGSVVDSFALTVLGQPAAWTTVVPAALSLFPGADGTIELHFAPPRAADVGAGPVPFGVRVVGSEDPDNPVVEEGELTLLPFVEVAAKLTPRTSETKRKSRHEIVIDNKGNDAVGVHLSVSDPDEQLAFELAESRVTVEAGQSRHVPVKVMARKGFARGGDKHRPFQAKVQADGQSFPITLDGNLIQKAGLPRFIFPLVAGVVALALIAAVVPSILNKDAKGNLQLTAEQGAVTTLPSGDAAEEEDPNAPATAEEAEALAAAEKAANGSDGATAAGGGSGTGDTGGATGGSGGGTSAAGTGTGTASGGSTSDGSTNTTAPRASTGAAPTTTAASGGGTSTGTGGGTGSSSTTSSTAPAAGAGGGTTTSTTSTTAAPRSGAAAFLGSWSGSDGSGMAIANSTTTKGVLNLKVDSPTMGAFTCTGSSADANDDNSFAGSCSDGRAHQFTYNSTSDRVSVSYPPPARSIEPCKCIVVFTRS